MSLEEGIFIVALVACIGGWIWWRGRAPASWEQDPSSSSHAAWPSEQGVKKEDPLGDVLRSVGIDPDAAPEPEQPRPAPLPKIGGVLDKGDVAQVWLLLRAAALQCTREHDRREVLRFLFERAFDLELVHDAIALVRKAETFSNNAGISSFNREGADSLWADVKGLIESEGRPDGLDEWLAAPVRGYNFSVVHARLDEPLSEQLRRLARGATDAGRVLIVETGMAMTDPTQRLGKALLDPVVQAELAGVDWFRVPMSFARRKSDPVVRAIGWRSWPGMFVVDVSGYPTGLQRTGCADTTPEIVAELRAFVRSAIEEEAV